MSRFFVFALGAGLVAGVGVAGASPSSKRVEVNCAPTGAAPSVVAPQSPSTVTETPSPLAPDQSFVAVAPPDSGLTAAPDNTVDISKLGVCDPVRVHFATNSDAIEAGDKAGLKKSAACLRTHGSDVMIEGGADARGGDDMNLELGARRAAAVAKFLKAQGVSSSQVRISTMGKADPLCSTDSATCFAENRRATVLPTIRTAQ